MTDTIELLETIGCDASLRYAAVDELTSLLEQVRASAELTQAVATGDGAPLRQACSLHEVVQVQHTHAIAFLDKE